MVSGLALAALQQDHVQSLQATAASSIAQAPPSPAAVHRRPPPCWDAAASPSDPCGAQSLSSPSTPQPGQPRSKPPGLLGPSGRSGLRYIHNPYSVDGPMWF
eukprot:EG_transcript_38759